MEEEASLEDLVEDLKKYQNQYNISNAYIRDMMGDVLFGTETKPHNVIIMTGRGGMRQLDLALRYDYMKNHKVPKHLFKNKRFKNTFEKIYNGRKKRR